MKNNNNLILCQWFEQASHIVLALAISAMLLAAAPLWAATLLKTREAPQPVQTENADAPDAQENTEATPPDHSALAEQAANEGGAGDLLIAPTRIVLDDKKRAGEISLNNRGSKEATFRISLQRMRMLENGNYEEAADAKPGEAYADDVIRFSPRQVVLKPGEAQSVKFAVKDLSKLPAGEYRIHAMFRGNPDMSKGTDIEQTTADNKQITVRLIPIYGVSIPVIVRHGDLNATAGISTAERHGKKVTMTITRQGNKSVYGDVVVMAKSGGEEITVGQVRGIAVFVPNAKRVVQVELNPPEGADISNAALSAVYREREEEGSKILAEAKVRG